MKKQYNKKRLYCILYQLSVDSRTLFDNIAVAIISLIHGAASVIINEKRFSRVDMMKDTEQFYKRCGYIRDELPSTRSKVNTLWVRSCLENFGESMCVFDKEQINDRTHTSVLVKVAVLALDDLISVTVVNRKKMLLESLVEPLERFHNFIDPEGRLFKAYGLTDKMLGIFYNEIGFVR